MPLFISITYISDWLGFACSVNYVYWVRFKSLRSLIRQRSICLSIYKRQCTYTKIYSLHWQSIQPLEYYNLILYARICMIIHMFFLYLCFCWMKRVIKLFVSNPITHLPLYSPILSCIILLLSITSPLANLINYLPFTFRLQ